MTKYNYIKNLNDDKFKLLTGVKKDTFELMLLKLKEAQKKKRQTGFIISIVYIMLFQNRIAGCLNIAQLTKISLEW